MTNEKIESKDCWIYRSDRKSEMYLYLPEKDEFDSVPEPLMKAFGPPAFVMQLQLHPEKALAREDVNKVMDGLNAQGFYLQMPPKIESLLPPVEDD